jgi:phosphatidate cytidylyltransferase
MKRVLTAAVLIPLVLLAVFQAPNWLFSGFVGLVALLALQEYLVLAAGYGYEPFRTLTFMLMLTLFVIFVWATWTPSPQGISVLITLVFFFALAPFIYLCAGMTRKDMRAVLPGAAVSYIALPFIGFSLASIVILRILPIGWFYLLFTFFAVWIGDTAAYYIGRSLGKTKFAPSISPKKTWEGAIASVVGSVIVGILLARFGESIQNGLTNIHLLRQDFGVPHASIGIAAFAAVIINIAGQLGDLLESLIKRGAGVKDSGSLLPGHGGILDRIDALLFAAPVALLVFGSLQDRFVKLF